MSSKTSGKQIQLEGMSIQCETCSKPIGKKRGNLPLRMLCYNHAHVTKLHKI